MARGTLIRRLIIPSIIGAAIAGSASDGDEAFGGGPTIMVDETADEINNDGDCSLREAFAAAVNNVQVDGCPAGHPLGTDEIVLQSGLTYDISDGGSLFDGGGPIKVGTQGGPAKAVIDAAGQHRVLLVSQDDPVEIDDITIANGSSASTGGGIFNSGNLTLDSVSFTGNHSDANGGGILSSGTLRVSNSLFTANTAGLDGGGLVNTGSAIVIDTSFTGNGSLGAAVANNNNITIRRSLISGNSSAGFGDDGALGGMATLENVTISGNQGGAVRVTGGAATLTNVTIAGNTKDGEPLGIIIFQGDVILQNTMIANGEGSANCNIPATSLGNNLENGDTCGLNQPGDQPNTNPQLGSLQDNGGPTFTHALLDGSPAIDAGDDIACPEVDQRGEPRPQGGGCDIGAYESPFSAPTPTPTPSPTPTPTPSATPQPLTQGDVDCSGAVDAVDALKELRHVAQLSVSQTEPCPDIGDEVGFTWGDVDCATGVSSVDALKILRHVAGLTVTQSDPCPDIGTPEGG